MAIVSSSIRRSLPRFLARTVSKTNANAVAVGRGRGASACTRRTVHSTRVLSGDALDMADTFSRRHGKNTFCIWMICRFAFFVFVLTTTCCLPVAIRIAIHLKNQWAPATMMPASCSNPSASTPLNLSYLLPSPPTFSPPNRSTYRHQ